MEWLLVAVLAMVLLGTSFACLVLLIARQRVQRHHRVDPSVPTEAPLSAMVDPRAAARLHRRLARIGTSTTTIIDAARPKRRRDRTGDLAPVASVAHDLRAKAVALDLQVTRLAVLAPSARRQPMVEVHRQVAEIEAAAAQLVAIDAHARAPRGVSQNDVGLWDITQRVDRLAQAHQELIDLETDAGLVSSPLPAPPLTTRSQPGSPAGGSAHQ